MMIYNGLYIDKQRRIGGRNGQHTGGRGFVQTSGTTRTCNNRQFFARCQSQLRKEHYTHTIKNTIHIHLEQEYT